MSELVVGSLKGLAANGFVIDVASGSKLVQPGAVLQVVSTAKTDTFSTSSTSYVDVTGLSVSITPTSATSKIFISATVPTSALGSSNVKFFTLTRGTTELLVPTSPGSRQSAGFSLVQTNLAEDMISATLQFLDSPATTSAIEYKVRGKMSGATAGNALYVNRGTTDTDTFTFPRGVATITLMEVAG